jgi:molybdopterin-guanine dinucleotide biosynthesis protein A
VNKNLLMISAVVLAGGNSKRFGKDKALLKLGGKPLILHVLDNITEVTEETIVVVGSQSQLNQYSKTLPSTTKIVSDTYKVQSPLAGALSGFQHVEGKYTLLLACDTPFISKNAVTILLNSCIGKDAAIPKWPNNYIEPLHAIYNTSSAFNAGEKALDNRRLNMASMIQNLKETHFVEVEAFKKADPELLTFYNINDLNDLKKAQKLYDDRFQ